MPVSRMDEVLVQALTRKLTPIEWDEATAKPVEPVVTDEEDSSSVIAH
jgi:hypothetical protein